jgi:hypothetical protein
MCVDRRWSAVELFPQLVERSQFGPSERLNTRTIAFYADGTGWVGDKCVSLGCPGCGRGGRCGWGESVTTNLVRYG